MNNPARSSLPKDPFESVSVLVTSDPQTAAGFVHAETSASVSESEANELLPPPALESPDDLLASAFPRFVRNRGADMSMVIGSFVEGLKDVLERALSVGWGDDVSVEGRYGTERLDGEGRPVVWAEFYAPDLEAYLIPHPVHVQAVVSGGAVFSDDVFAPERFLLGPARMLLTLNSEQSAVVSFQPWISKVCIEEAESRFIAHVRRAAVEGSSVFGAMVDECVVNFMRDRGLIDVPEWTDGLVTALAARGAGSVESTSSATTGERVFNMRFSLGETVANPSDSLPLISCAVTLRDDDIWGLVLAKVRVTLE